MNLFRRTVHLLLAGCLTAAAFSLSPAQAADPLVIKFSHVVSEDAPKGKAALFFKTLAEDLTHGQVQVQVYPNSQLYKDKEEMEALQLGAVQMLAPTISKFAPLGIREFEVFDLPYLFTDMAEAKKITQGPIGQKLLQKLDDKGITGLAFWDNAFKQMTANAPLRTPEDYHGLKMRIQSSKVLDAQMRQLGALPQVMAFSELYQGLQTGVVDGQENPATNIFTQKLHEVQKHMTLTDHGYHGYAVIVNKRFWSELPPDIRTALTEAMRQTTLYFSELAATDEENALSAIRASGKVTVHLPTPAEKDALRKALLPVHEAMQERFGSQILTEINAGLGR